MQSLESALLVSLCIIWGGVQASPKLSCPLGPESLGLHWMADSDNCSVFFLCYGGQRFDFNCGENVWDSETKTCVAKGSQWDKCSVLKALDDVSGDVTCREGSTAVFAKADNCAQFYDCSSREATISSDPTLRECAYPLLFNAESKRCEHFEQVTCGQRQEPLDACDYRANQCSRSSHCIPCDVRFPSCRGLTNGLNPWVGREYSPFFVLCQSQRPVYQGQCQGGQIFHPEQLVCAAVNTGNRN